MFWERRGEFTKGFLEKVTFGLTFEERLFMFGDEVKKAFQEEEKAVSMGTEAGMPKSQVRKGKLPGMVQT